MNFLCELKANRLFQAQFKSLCVIMISYTKYYLSVQNIGWVVMFIYLFNSMLYFQILTSVRTRALVTPMLLVRIAKVITHVLVMSGYSGNGSVCTGMYGN